MKIVHVNTWVCVCVCKTYANRVRIQIAIGVQVAGTGAHFVLDAIEFAAQHRWPNAERGAHRRRGNARGVRAHRTGRRRQDGDRGDRIANWCR